MDERIESFLADVLALEGDNANAIREGVHDETYMPKEIADALKKTGHWKDDYASKTAMPVAGGTQ